MLIEFEIEFNYLRCLLFNPLHSNISMYILHTVLLDADMKNLSNNQEPLSSVISSLILLTLMFDSGVVW